MSWVPPSTQKLTTIGPAGTPGTGVKYNVFFHFFGDFLPSSREQMERHISVIFCTK